MLPVRRLLATAGQLANGSQQQQLAAEVIGKRQPARFQGRRVILQGSQAGAARLGEGIPGHAG